MAERSPPYLPGKVGRGPAIPTARAVAADHLEAFARDLLKRSLAAPACNSAIFENSNLATKCPQVDTGHDDKYQNGLRRQRRRPL
jgi:hypothetical protein